MPPVREPLHVKAVDEVENKPLLKDGIQISQNENAAGLLCLR